MSDKLETLEDLFQEQLKDLYSAETQLLKAMPSMAGEAKDQRLMQSLELHRQETENQVTRLEQIAQERGIDLGGHTCKAMQGLIAEGMETLSEGRQRRSAGCRPDCFGPSALSTTK